MTEVRILLKHSASQCNRALLGYLHTNIDSLKRQLQVKTIIVYDNEISVLNGKIKQLPALIVSGRAPITGSDAIKKYLNQYTAGLETGDAFDLDNYWNDEIRMREGEGDSDAEGDLMDAVKSRALEHTEHRKSVTKSRNQKQGSSHVDDDIPARSGGSHKEDDSPTSDNICMEPIVDDDPDMAKYWANQENTPGF